MGRSQNPPDPDSLPARLTAALAAKAGTSETIHLPAFSEDEEKLYEELRLCLAVARARFGSVRDVEFKLLLQGHVPSSGMSVSMGSTSQRSKHYRRAVEQP